MHQNNEMERLIRMQERSAEMSRLKGQQDALMTLVREINHYKVTSYRKTIDVDTVTGMLWNHIYENKDEVTALVDELNGKGKVLHLDDINKWRYGS